MDNLVDKSQLPDVFIEEIASQRGVTRTELEALRLALQGLPGSEIATRLNISKAAVRKRLGESYKKFKIDGSGNRKIYDLKQKLSQDYQALQAKKPKTNEDWGEAVDVKGFQGREDEISELKGWIVDGRCRLVAILGLAGIGKTMLAARIVNEVRDKFEYIIWRSLRNSPQLNDILTEILEFLPKDNRINLKLESDNHNKKILYLIDVLRKHRCLIIFDNVESLFSSSHEKDHELAGKYESGYENYGDLFHKISETSHQSCLLLTSREKPLQVAMLEGKNLPVKVLQLIGLKLEDAEAVLKDKGFTSSTSSEENLEELVKLYSGNPLALKMVATTLYDLFDNDVDEFLNQINKKTAVYGDIRTLLEEQFNRLSLLEKQLMYWFAINRDFVSLADMKKDLIKADNIKILEAVESLLRRSLIEKVAAKVAAVGVNNRRFSQPSVVKEFITERLIVQASEEIIRGGDLKIISEYPLIKAGSLDYFRQSQERSILEPLKKQLVDFFGNEDELKLHFKKILKQLQESSPKKGYAAGNIINLLRYLQIDESQINLSGSDFSNLAIWQAYFKDVRLQKTQFTNSDLRGSVFSDTMSSLVSVSFSHDGKYFATGVINGEVRLWQAEDIKLLDILKGHNVWVWTFAFSPNNKILASGSADSTIKLWDIDRGKCLLTLEDNSKVYSVAFDMDGKLLASSSEDRTIKIWDIKDIENIENDEYQKKLNIKTDKYQKKLTGHSGSVWSVAFHPKKKNIIASSSADGSIKLWDIDNEKCLHTLTEHKEDVYAIDFHPQGELLVSCGDDKTIKLWELERGTCIKTLSGVDAHQRKVYKVRFSKDGDTIASCSEDRTIKLWDTKTGNLKRTLSGHESQVWDIAFNPSGRTLISSSDDQTARVWNIETGVCWNILKGYTRDVYSLAFNHDNTILASGRDDWTIRLWKFQPELQKFECFPLRAHKGRIRSVAFNPCDNTLASGSADRQIKLWDVDVENIRNTKEIKTLVGHENWVWGLVFSPDGKRIASSSEDRTILLWDVEKGRVERIIRHSHDVLCVAFDGDGKVLASGSADNRVILWNAATGERIKILNEHKDYVWSVAFHRDGNLLASGSQDKTIKIWDTSTGKCLYSLEAHTEQVYSVAFSPDGEMLASGSGDSTVKLWDTNTGKLLHTFADEHTGAIRSVTFSPNGNFLASGRDDEKILLWNPKTFKCLDTLKSDRFYEDMEITGIKGLTDSEKASLKVLGAKE
ncbi:MAG: NB-ARC domain-containing protein [Cyanobacteria bacterium J06633_8]